MKLNFLKAVHLRNMLKAATLVIAPLLATSGHAATVTYDIAFGATTTTFTAPMGGGAVGDFTVTLGGVTFDTPDAVNPPLYNPTSNDIAAAGSLFGYFSNSIAGPGCPVGQCVLETETAVDAFTPPAYAAFNIVAFDGIISGGHYFITVAPVPLPAGSVLLLTALLAVIGLRKFGPSQSWARQPSVA